METKICTKCNVEFPNTNKFFTTYRNRYISKKGIEKLSISLTNRCKSCVNLESKKRRAKKMGITIEYYLENVLKEANTKRAIKYKELDRSNFTKKEVYGIVKRLAKGDDLNMAISGYKERTLIRLRKSSRKYNYNKPFTISLSKKEVAQKHKEILTDCYISACLNIPIKKIPKKIIEAKRQSIILKRKIKNNEQPQICN